MDRKSLLILAAAIAVVLVLYGMADRIFPPVQVPVVAQGPTNLPAADAATGSLTNLGSSNSAPSINNAIAATPTPASPEVLLAVTNSDLVFHFTSRGGGIKDIELRNTNYPAIVRSAQGTNHGDNFATLNNNAVTPILATSSDNYELSQPASNIVRAERVFASGLREVKEFAVGDSGTNYLFTAKDRFVNSSSSNLNLPDRKVVAGTTTAISPLDDVTAFGVMWYNGEKSEDIATSWFANRTLGCIPGTPRTNYDGGATNVYWAAMHSQYFVLASIPDHPAASINIRSVKLDPPSRDNVRENQALALTNQYDGFETAFVYPAETIAPGKSTEESFTFYAGPKEYNGLVKIGHFMGNNLDQAMGFTGYFGFSFFSKFLLISMDALHDTLGLHYGLCIIAITIIIKLVFWPLTASSTRAQKRQQALSPQLKAIAEKYKDDPIKKHEKTTALFKEHKINPLGSCLPMLITIPVFFGFYSMLRNSIELRGVPFLWAQDLTLPDTVAIVAGFHINLLPILMTLSQLWQSHLTPPSPGMDPEQQKIMRWMPLMFLMIFYRMSAGLNIYYTVSNLLTILQTTVTKMGADPAVVPGKAVLSSRKK